MSSCPLQDAMIAAAERVRDAKDDELSPEELAVLDGFFEGEEEEVAEEDPEEWTIQIEIA